MPKKGKWVFFGPRIIVFELFSKSVCYVFLKLYLITGIKKWLFLFWMKILIMPKMGEMGHFGLGGPLLLGTCSLYVFAFLVAFLLKSSFISQICHILFGIFWWKLSAYLEIKTNWFQDHDILLYQFNKICGMILTHLMPMVFFYTS